MNRTYSYYHSVYTGNQYVWAAELAINAELGISFFQYISQTYGGTACERFVRNDLFGKLILHPSPPASFLWFEMPVKGEQVFKDACDPALDSTKPISGTDTYGVNLLDVNGTNIQLYNANYKGTGFDNFVMHRITARAITVGRCLRRDLFLRPAIRSPAISSRRPRERSRPG